MSFPSRERGLKHPRIRASCVELDASFPSRERGLKPEFTTIEVDGALGRSLRGNVD